MMLINSYWIMQNEKARDCPTNNTTSTSDASYSL